MSKYPLEGVRVVALEQYIAGPYCSMWLADCGADVIKVERPEGGDPRRNYPPAIEGANGEKVFGGFVTYNRNKRSIALDLTSLEGKELYRQLVAGADVVVENLKPGAAEKLGIGPSTLCDSNPRLIYAAISGFGRMPEFAGPYSTWPAFDPVIQAMAGISHLLGEENGPPELGFLGLADLVTGITTAFQITLALFMREQTGIGQIIDSSMYESLVALNERSVMLKTFSGEVLSRGKDKYQAPAGTFEVQDGWVALIAPNDAIWARLCEAVGKPEWISDDLTATGPKRAANRSRWEPELVGWLRERTSSEVVERLIGYGVPVGPVQTSEDLLACPHLEARRAFVQVEDPIAGTLTLARAPVRMSGMDEVPTRSAPRLGQDTVTIANELGYSNEEVLRLIGEGVLGFVGHSTTPGVQDKTNRKDFRSLAATRCEVCGQTYYPPRNMCVNCLDNGKIRSTELSKRGILYSWSIVHVGPKGVPVPYAIGYVDFPEDVRVLGRIANWQGVNIHSGADIEVEVENATIESGREEAQQFHFVVLRQEED